MKFIVLLGRILYALIFILASFPLFSGASIEFAAHQGIPLAAFFVPCAGLCALVGGLSILLGYKARYGAWLIVIFLIPVTFAFHNFWSLSDNIAKQIELVSFMKNMSMLGAALMITQLGSGSYSLSKK